MNLNNLLTSASLALCLAATATVATAGTTALVDGDPAAGEAKAMACAACHGPSGNSSNPAWPKIAGQHARYLEKELIDFKAGTNRSHALMTPVVAPLSEQDMKDLAAYFAVQKLQGGYADEKHVQLGEKLYRGGSFAAGFAACMSCHGPSGHGNPLGGIPIVSGQHAEYTALQLKAFRSGERSNDPYGIMRDVAKRMTDKEIRAVSEYIAGLH
ncbi:MAG: c-type cytochrome [Gammaproteobacteria bacterium]